jgi:hypothetical protein
MEFLKPKHDETHEEYLGRESYTSLYALRLSPTIYVLNEKGYEINQPIRNFLNELLPPMVEDMIEKEKTHLSVIRDNE